MLRKLNSFIEKWMALVTPTCLLPVSYTHLLPIAFLVIWCSRKYQIKLFEKQVETKLNASSQVQEYLEAVSYTHLDVYKRQPY